MIDSYMKNTFFAAAITAIIFVSPALATDNSSTSVYVSTLRAKAEKGDAIAEYNLALAYHNGDGVTKDDAEAVKWYGKAAEQGYVPAQYSLSIMYSEDGYGVDKDLPQAIKWCRAAVEQGYAGAERKLGEM